jgi:hypothetical protein
MQAILLIKYSIDFDKISTKYDQKSAKFVGLLKFQDQYQESCQRYTWELP